MGRLQDAAKSGSTEKLLAALRDDMAATLDGGVPPRDYAAIAKSLIQVAERLDEISKERSKAKSKAVNRMKSASDRFKVVA